MMRALHRSAQGMFRADVEPAQFAVALREPGGLLWVDLDREPPQACEPLLREVFGFHPLAVEDALQESHLPKVDEWDKYLYAVLHSVSRASPAAEGEALVEPQELDIFLGSNYLVTYHTTPIAAVDRVWAKSVRDDPRLAAGPDHLLYELADELAEAYFPLVDSLSETADELQDLVLEAPTTATLQRILALKRTLLRLQRITGPQREVLARLARDEYALVDARDRVYFRDVYDQFVQLHDQYESLRDLVTGSLDTYLSVINNRLNEVMKKLTIIATFFMPASFIVGFFGMNRPLDVLEYWTKAPGAAGLVAAATLVTLVATFIATYWIMRRRRWM